MGVTYIDGRVSNGSGKRRAVKFLVDSGAAYSLLPPPVWREIGLKPVRTQAFRLADGTEVERQVSECYIELPQGKGHTPVILGIRGDQALLGAVTLEELGLVLNPFSRTLHPMRALLA